MITRTVPNCPYGDLATFQFRAWDVGRTGIETYEDAMALQGSQEFYAGVGNIFTIATGGGSVAPTYLSPAQPFSMAYFPAVPEPSIIGLGIVGAAAAMLPFRRRE
jgi:hypothetical protein